MTISVLLSALVGAWIAFFGDAHFDRGVRSAMRGDSPATLFASTRGLRDSSDISLLNLETPLCESWIPPVAKPIALRSDPGIATSLRSAGFTHAILANNHSMDRGGKGLARTIDLLRKAGIRPVGASTTGDPCAPVYAMTGTDSVALLAIAVLPGIDQRHVCADTSALHLHLLVLERRGIPSVVSLHWGVEYSGAVSRSQHELARKMVEWGADALVGHHAHVVQSEVGRIPSTIDGRPVWYGIGNFIFDQYEPWTERALAVRLSVRNRRVDRWSTIELVRHGPRIEHAKPKREAP